MIGAPISEERLTLYGSFTSSSSYKPMLYLALAGLPFSFRTVNLKTGVQNTPEYLAINRWGVVPSLRHRGLTILQSNVILDYLARATGHFEGRTEQQRWQAREWLSWEADHITAIARVRHSGAIPQDARRGHRGVATSRRSSVVSRRPYGEGPALPCRQRVHDCGYRMLGSHGVHGRGWVRNRALAPFKSLGRSPQGDAWLRAALRPDPQQGQRFPGSTALLSK